MKKKIFIGVLIAIAISSIIATAYLVTKKVTRTNIGVKKTNNQANQKNSLENLDFTQLYRSVIFDKDAKPSIDRKLLQYELMRVLSTRFINQIERGTIEVEKVSEKEWNFHIIVYWTNGGKSILDKTVSIHSLAKI